MVDFSTGATNAKKNAHDEARAHVPYTNGICEIAHLRGAGSARGACGRASAAHLEASLIPQSVQRAHAALVVRAQVYVACRSAMKVAVELGRCDSRAAFRTLKQGATALVTLQLACDMLRETALHEKALLLAERGREAMSHAYARAWRHFPQAVNTLIAAADLSESP